METLLYTLKLAAIMALNALVTNQLARLLTEYRRPVFNFKPFNCRPCLTFWLTLATGAPLIFAYSEQALAVSIVLICTALINFLIITSKIQINE